MRKFFIPAAAVLLLSGSGTVFAQTSNEQNPAQATTSGAAQEKAERRENKTSSQNAADEAQAGKHTRAMGKDTKSQSDLDAEKRAK